jgi:hypothetical protein
VGEPLFRCEKEEKECFCDSLQSMRDVHDDNDAITNES